MREIQPGRSSTCAMRAAVPSQSRREYPSTTLKVEEPLCSRPAPRWALRLDLAVELRGGEKSALVRRNSFARRYSRTSRSSWAIRLASTLVVPERTPPTISAGWTQSHNAGCTPSCTATLEIAPCFVDGSLHNSTANPLDPRQRHRWLDHHQTKAIPRALLPALPDPNYIRHPRPTGRLHPK